MESRKKIIFLGDSITDAGHDLQMVPEGQSRLGDGYVSRCIFHSCSTTCTSILSQSHGR